MVEAPIITDPVTEIMAAAANVTDVPEPTLLVSEPATVNVVAGIVLTTDPEEELNIRLPYVFAEITWFVPLYSTVLDNGKV